MAKRLLLFGLTVLLLVVVGKVGGALLRGVLYVSLRFQFGGRAFLTTARYKGDCCTKQDQSQGKVS